MAIFVSKRATLVAAMSLLLAPAAFAQTQVEDPMTQPMTEPLPPPGLDESRRGETDLDSSETVALPGEEGPGEKVIPRARTTPPADEQPLPEKVRPSDELAPAVTIRNEGDNVVEEYRRDGQIYMVRVVPKRGPAYEYIDTDGDGRLEGDPKEGPMQPVYYTLYEWQ